MIELNEKTQQDFLNREWVQRLLDAEVDMSDAKYMILHTVPDEYSSEEKDYVVLAKDHYPYESEKPVPTYTVSELLYKLHEWIYPTIDDIEYSGPLTFLKDAPFYTFFYSLRSKDDPDTRKVKLQQEYICAEFEYPIESLASLLIQCHKKDIGLKNKDTGNISDK